MTALRLRARLALSVVAAALVASACVTVDAETNEVVPRGNQRYKMELVKQYAEKLELGMNKFQVLTTVGSPAEETNRGDTWIYLPERSAILIPSKALHLMFEDNQLTSKEWRPIVLGENL